MKWIKVIATLYTDDPALLNIAYTYSVVSGPWEGSFNCVTSYWCIGTDWTIINSMASQVTFAAND